MHNAKKLWKKNEKIRDFLTNFHLGRKFGSHPG